jgi:uncharacterized protein (TIGR02145 family)
MKKYLIIISLITVCHSLMGQYMLIHINNTIINLPINKIDSITFLTSDTTILDIDGNVYNVITIGSQTWLREDLKVTRYQNGDTIGTTIPATLNTSGETEPKYQWAYGGNEQNVKDYGRLYTWWAAMDSRGACPLGWRVPNDNDWNTLIQSNGWYIEAGGKLKETGTEHWISPNTGATNSTGFTAIPGGYKDFIGNFQNFGTNVFWYSATENDAASANLWTIWNDQTGISSSWTYKNSGLSIRCIKE